MSKLHISQSVFCVLKRKQYHFYSFKRTSDPNLLESWCNFQQVKLSGFQNKLSLSHMSLLVEGKYQQTSIFLLLLDIIAFLRFFCSDCNHLFKRMPASGEGGSSTKQGDDAFRRRITQTSLDTHAHCSSSPDQKARGKACGTSEVPYPVPGDGQCPLHN